MAFDFDLFVIGGGSGGVRAARLAASEGGAKVGLAEEYRMGGTCVIRGCVPKKLMVFASAFKDQIEDAASYGWDVNSGPFDWQVFRPKLRAELDRLENAYRNTLKNNTVQTFDARAELVDPHRVRLSTGEEFTCKHILVATGGRPFVPEFPGSDLAITSNEIFLWEELPKRVLIVGGGFIACEFACILHGLGVEVTQFYRGAQILRGFDDEARGHIAASMEDRGINLRLGENVETITKKDDGLHVRSTSANDGVFDAVIYATGRVPNTEKLGLEKAGVETGNKGEILVDDYSQTNVPSVFAVGDVTDRINLTPVAIREGAAFVETVFKGNPTKPDHDLVASAVFTQPEFGTVGMTEEEARETGTIEVYCTSFRPMQTLFAGREDKVFMKLLVAQESRKVLGCHIVAPMAGEMIQLAGIAIKMGATKEDFDRTCAVHPVMAEELVTMKSPTRVV
ncbi:MULTISPECIES: glutathione-disulfide reductase [Halocynthiibacter]|uniref:Glutathione reductase n=1 Tax=Halocynthiibacter halioticoli TaxID=2986804 RepID=A0AAE3LQS1_9RHOB|nr:MULTISPECIES: glutathione-disulfide reductase [Halocynthiibacter]MCV6823843.1 glutathione-disulfide reductase [Halocynthiibacter halioticoli]MCW4056844.1 glutathione-disulfide reductase [Halocynthiibacter sp. SDUM655004]